MEDVYIAGAYVTAFGKFPDKSLRVLTVRASLCGRAMQTITTRRLATLTRDPRQAQFGFKLLF